MLTLPSMCNVYRSDIGKLCDGEMLSQGSLKGGRAALFSWMERAVSSSEGIILVRDLEGKDTRGIGVELRDEARKVGLSTCALADQADMQAKDDDLRADLSNLCAGSAPRSDGSIARLDLLTVDDAERGRELVEWVRRNARSTDTVAIVQKVVAAAPKQRGAALRAEAGKLGVTSCAMATTLDAPPPEVAPVGTPPAAPSYVVVKVETAAKNVYAIASALVADDAASAINACYAALLGASPKASGRVTMKLTPDSTGRVIKASDEGSQLKGPVVDCLAKAMRSVATNGPLPETGRKAKATVTLLLTPAPPGAGNGAAIEPGYLETIRPHGTMASRK